MMHRSHRSIQELRAGRFTVLGLVGCSSALVFLLASPNGFGQDEQATEAAASGPGVSTSERCIQCHAASPEATAMRDEKERPIAPFDLWQSTMMANSARDPFWRAVMSAEIAATPNAERAIEAECMKCHTPLASQVGLSDHGTGDLAHALDCDGELGELARDGVSCTICHGIAPGNLGTPESFSAGFRLNHDQVLYGPHDEVFPRPMQMHSGFTPMYGEHMTQSKLCGSCHTLQTHALNPDGSAVGQSLNEQTPYLEWRNSAYSNEDPDGALMERPSPGARTCQACHMPTLDADRRPIETRIAHNPGGFDFPFLEPRSPFGRHLLVGGNAFMLTMLRDNAEALGVKAPRAAFDATIQETKRQLEERTAQVAISDVSHGEERFDFDVTVTNFAGHKLPSGHPSRRMWLEIIVEDAAGARILASGVPDASGRIIGADGKVLPTECRGGPIEPHRQEIRDSGQVVRYRAIMADKDGETTFSLLRAASWSIDDRILPRGWRRDHPDAENTAPYGTGGDADYAPEDGASGRDRVHVSTALIAAPAAKITVRLLYQPISPRYVDEIAAYDTPEIERFLELYGHADRAPEVLATGSWTAPR